MTRLFALALLALPQEPVPDREGVEFFEKRIRPVLVDKCYSCHSAGAEKLKAELLTDTREGLLKGGETGPALVPGDPDRSLLIRAIRYTDEDLKMPPKNRLPKEVVADFEAWVRRGAPDPRTGAAKVAKAGIDLEKGRRFWSMRPLASAEPPAVKQGSRVRTPVDRFILAKLEEKGIAPNGPADRRRLLRRASLDLLGMPPAPDEVDAFVADPAPDAWERAVDRLLASPQLGERWARYWLDVARFAESHGFEQDYNREHAWPYRDFVIRALNDDLPYDRFVQWQVAGDELAPDDPQAWMATGFLGAGAFPTQLTEVEFEPARYDELDSMVSTVGSAMLGLSVGCARCHDHKFDPIPARDYYRLASTFTTAIRSHVDFELDPEGDRRALASWEKARQPLAAALRTFEAEALPARYAAWVASKPWEKEAPPGWVALEVEPASQGGASFARQADGSLLLSGENPKHDRWTLTARTSLEGLAAVRLEALADPSLKRGGPGRADNGNFALTDFRLTARSADGKGEAVPVKLVDPKATFQQNATNLSVAASIDGDKASGWAVDPQFGKPHAAVFRFAEPVGFPGGTLLVFELGFEANAKHAIGRPRLSVTSGAAGLAGEPRPQATAELLERLRRGGAPEGGAAVYARIDPDWLRLEKALRAHEAKRPQPKKTTVLVTTEGLKPLKHHADDRGFPHFYKETHVLARGDVNRKQGVAAPGFLQVLSRDAEGRWTGSPPREARTPHRRAALARWLTDVEAGAGGLAARVIANRLWHHHFGRGIVATPNDFGAQGEPPTHPELLEWLAGELVRGGWRLKPVHKLLMTSAVYMQSAASDPARERLDPENRLLWRWTPRRLEAEAIRDSMLAVSGTLDRTMYGPGTLDEKMDRRSVYFMTKRSQLISMMMVFDAPEQLVSIGSRPTTTVAPQALLFMNSPHVRRYAANFAKRLPAAPAEAVRAGYRTALGREPSEAEARSAEAFLERQRASYRGEGKPETAALADFCQVLFSASEFIYVQ